MRTKSNLNSFDSLQWRRPSSRCSASRRPSRTSTASDTASTAREMKWWKIFFFFYKFTILIDLKVNFPLLLKSLVLDGQGSSSERRSFKYPVVRNSFDRNVDKRNNVQNNICNPRTLPFVAVGQIISIDRTFVKTYFRSSFSFNRFSDERTCRVLDQTKPGVELTDNRNLLKSK